MAKFPISKPAQLKQAIDFILREAKQVEVILERKLGKQAAALFAISSAGSMAAALNRMGVPNLNAQLSKMIEARAPQSGLPCDAWTSSAAMIAARANP